MDETKAKRLRSWRRHWCEFLPSIGITGDVFLDEFSTWQRQLILVAFAQSIRNADYCGKSNQRRAWLQAGTVKYSIGYLSQAFKAVQQPDPRRDAGGDICFLLEQTYRGYTNQDPGVVQQQKALPAVSVLKMMQKLATTNLAIAQADLAEGAFFFVMRSCEYSKTSTKEESKCTKIIRVYNIKFFANSRIRHHDHDQLEDSDFVQITFEYIMKNDDRNESVRMFKA